MRENNPLFGKQPFKVGVFAYLHEGAMTLSKAPERWKARWPDIAALAKMTDDAGLDFMLPISSWSGWHGEIDHRVWSFETLTHAAALAGLTRRVAVLATVHAPLVHPVFAAKALATIDHASNGRAGVNIVCGWNTADFKMFGMEQLEHDERYRHGLEWWQLLTTLLKGESRPFNHKGKYFDLEDLTSQPGSVQRPYPAILSAAFSPAGRDYAARTSDFLLTSSGGLNKAAEELKDIRAREKAVNRKTPLGVISTATLVCRETRKEAEQFNRYYSLEMADNVAVDKYTSLRGQLAANPDFGSQEALRIRAAGGGTLVGTPEDIVDGFLKMREAGVDGVALHFLNFTNDLPFILERVVPLMKQAGLRIDEQLVAAA